MPPQTNKTKDDKKNGSAPFAAQLETAKQKLFGDGVPDRVDPQMVAEAMGAEIVPADQVPAIIVIAANATAEPAPAAEVAADTAANVADGAPEAPPVAETEEMEMQRLDYSKIATRLYQGSAPRLDHDYARFTMIVLCATEHQPALPIFRGKLIRAGFNDTSDPTKQDILTAGAAAEVVFRELVSGGTVLVTCWQGRNRSGLVTGLVMGRKMPGEHALALVRESRPSALTNETYAELVRRSATIPAKSIVSAAAVGQAGAAHTAAHATAGAPGVVERVLKRVFVRSPGKPRGVGAPPKQGAGRGFYGKARTERTPKRTAPARGGGR